MTATAAQRINQAFYDEIPAHAYHVNWPLQAVFTGLSQQDWVCNLHLWTRIAVSGVEWLCACFHGCQLKDYYKTVNSLPDWMDISVWAL